ncbi:MAG: efflux RND transporter permease subunit [Bacteroidota bacterium]
MKKRSFREFAPSSWAIDNRTTIFLLAIFVTILGVATYNGLPKENFPEVKFPVIYVSTPYPGTSAADIENLVTREIEKEIKGTEGIKKINSTSIQDYSMVFVEFETGVEMEEAKQDIKDAVDRAKGELPTDLPNEPSVTDINFSEIPVMFINISGNFDNVTLKRYAEDIQDELEKRKEVLRADIVGTREREIQVNVDLFKMQANRITMNDIEQAISGENVIISGGELDVSQQKIAIRVNGEFQDVREVQNLLIRSGQGDVAYLREIADVRDTFEDIESYARYEGNPVITLNVIKKAGENLVIAADGIKATLEEMQEKQFPEGLTITVTGDQSLLTIGMLNELTNTIVFGFILVTLVLMFFMGIRDALFVGLAVPLSSFIAFLFIPSLGYSLNIIVLFSFILAMGIVVDNAIVVIENTYRIYMEQGLPIVSAAKKAAGEVIAPVFAGTLTTVCPFLPLLFWPGLVGEFMKYLPVILIITLFASLFVAYIINPVFAATFMRKAGDPQVARKNALIYGGIGVFLGILFHLPGIPMVGGLAILAGLVGYIYQSVVIKKSDPKKAARNGLVFILGGLATGIILMFDATPAMGNLLIFMAIFVVLYQYAIIHAVNWFQQNVIPAIKNGYKNIIAWSIAKTWHSNLVLWGSLGLVIISFMIFGSRDIRFVQFPEPDPNFVYVYNEMPGGTDIQATDSVTKELEKIVYTTLGDNNPLVKSIISNVGIGAGDANSFDQGTSQPHKGRVTIEFVQAKDRKGASTKKILEELRENVKGIYGTKVTVDREPTGPPGAAPVEITLQGEEFAALMEESTDLFQFLDSVNIEGIEKLKWDVDDKKQEFLIDINRQKASELGISSGQIGMALRGAVFGSEAAQFRDKEDEYPIQVRLAKKYRNDINTLMNMDIRYMDQSTGSFKSVPISAVADFTLSSDYGGINRKDLEKSVSISSNILSDADPNAIFMELRYWVSVFKKQGRNSPLVDIEVGGIVLEQQDEMGFLSGAFGVAVLLIFMILVTQFNSFSNVLIVLSQVFLSVAGVFLGYGLTGMDFSVVMSGMGIVVLAGIVVNNGIILMDFFRIMEKEGRSLEESVIEGGAVRFTPVLLTASSTILGLIPLAVSFNLNFGTLLSSLDPQIFFGGDNAAFWKPFSWTIIFGLGFATLVTLLFVPVLYYRVMKFSRYMSEHLGWGSAQIKPESDEQEGSDEESDYQNNRDKYFQDQDESENPAPAEYFG